jgi:DNA (cytosine-5)-methyltransferase 1
MKHLDLFAGIGGFALACRWANIETVGFCEIDEFCIKILNKNFPNIPNHTDITKLNGATYENIDLLTAGFPCQPYSVSGKQKGQNDPRDMLCELLRVISESKPRWLILENSPNALNMVFGKIKSELESIGYEVAEPLCIPACAVNADHRRQRAWICANLNPCGLQRGSEKAFQGFPSLSLKSTGIFESQRSRQRLSEPRNIRSYNGLPNGVDRIKSLGNSLVPQLAYRLIEIIKYVDRLGYRK